MGSKEEGVRGRVGSKVLVNLRVPCPCHPQVWGPLQRMPLAHINPLLSLASRAAAHFLGVFQITRNPGDPTQPEGTVL